MASNIQGSAVKTLLVDDMPVHNLVLSTMLRMLHCEITVVVNGKDALDLFITGKKFDIVFIEKHIPLMTGPEAVEKIRAIGETDVKIVGVSIDDDAKEAFMRAGADVFFPMPLKLDVVKAMIQEVINKKNNAMGVA